jgi:hypothetical protein
VALGWRGDERAAPVLLQMLDAGAMATVDGLSPEQREEAVIQAMAAAAGLRDPALRSAIERLGNDDPSLKVRDASRAVLQAAPPEAAASGEP